MTLRVEDERRMLAVVASCDARENLTWTVTDGTVAWVVLCNDLFWWATADAEPIETAADVDMLESCASDLATIGADATYWVAALYACRRRQMRPQGACFRFFASVCPEMVRFLDEAGPPRDGDNSPFGNPTAHDAAVDRGLAMRRRASAAEALVRALAVVPWLPPDVVAAIDAYNAADERVPEW